MIISRTPYRISFFGGGTDYPLWYRQHGGAVLGATIDKYCYIHCRYLPPFFEHRLRVVYSQIETCQRIDEIAHPAVREVLRFLGIGRGIEIHHVGDLPARSGIGSSSSFTVGLLHALYALQGKMIGKHRLAMEGIHLEQDVLKETVGSQDQVLAAYGGVNHVTFLPSGEISVRPVMMPRGRIQELNRHLMLFYTGIKRTAASVAQSYVPDLDERRRQMRTLMHLVEESLSLLSGSGDICAFGELLHEAWDTKRSLSRAVSNTWIDETYEQARGLGAIGGKLLGAGGGGFLLLFVPPERQEALRRGFKGLIHVPFKFEFGGSQIIFYDEELDYEREDIERSGEFVAFRELTEL